MVITQGIRCWGQPITSLRTIVKTDAPSIASACARAALSSLLHPNPAVLSPMECSQDSRNERNANAGIVVGITPDDYPGHPLQGIAFQRHWEQCAFRAGGEDYFAPGQRVGDFLAGRPSATVGAVVPSYTPGVRMTDVAPYPEDAVEAIREALPGSDRQYKRLCNARCGANGS